MLAKKIKLILYILTFIIGLITSLFLWIFIQRNSLDYNSEGVFFSAEEGLVYHEQAKDAYGFLALLGLILTVLLILKLKR